MKVFISGGAGFIGLNVAKKLNVSDKVSEIILFDSLSKQIHGDSGIDLKMIPSKAKLIVGNVCDKNYFHDNLQDTDVVVHLAAETGTGQSMYEINKYNEVNIGGTANLLDYVVNYKNSIKKIVVASSRSIYGEGQYRCHEHGVVYPASRTVDDLDLGNFEPRCPACGEFVLAEATKENCPLSPSSFYGLTKRVQEEMILLFAKAKNIKGVALRYQNVYGPGQSLINPYTGILAVFSNLARAGKPIQIFEDGKESRDFVYVEDVASATSNAVLSSSIVTGAYNVGSGVSTDVATVARLISEYFGSKAPIILTGAYRLGDIRHNYASIDSLNMDTKFVPKWNFADGLKEFLDWAVTNEVQSNDAFAQSLNEMREKGFYRGA